MPGIFYVAIGGASGAVGRYLLSLLPTKGQFPVWTFATNFAGAVLIGFLAGLLSTKPEYSQKISLFWKTGVCGGFTTFSTFSLEAFTLLEKGNTVLGVVYIIGSVLTCLFGVYMGRTMFFFLH